jgi:hypothetical protein
VITYQRKSRAYGYFHGSRMHLLGEPGIPTDEIALNPATMKGMTRENILSTLVHEMAHLWQHHFGKASRNGYHNKQWAAKMIDIGLAPSDTGKPGGRETGQQMDHYIIRGGPFDRQAVVISKKETMPLYQDQAQAEEEDGKPKPASKTRYTCPTCLTNAWAKPETNLVCGDCDETMLTAEQLPEPEAPKLIEILGERDDA